MVEEFKKRGYIICGNVFTPNELDICKNEVNAYFLKNKIKINKNSNSIPDFVNKHKMLINTIRLKENATIHNALQNIFGGTNYRFCSHNDIGFNRIVPWHKDKLNGDVSKYQIHDIWTKIGNEEHEIVKVLIYLEDHSNDNDGLQLVPGSHLLREINGKGGIHLHPKKGDVIIFDQRITHRGMNKQSKDSRILVSFGFGKNNIFTDEFEKGTIIRQNQQNKLY